MPEWGRRQAAEGWTTGGRLRRLVLLCWAMLLLVSLAAVGSVQFQSENIRQLTMVTGPARNANDEVRQAMTDAQTGLYGYQLSGDRALLQPYFGAHRRTTAALTTLQDKLLLGAAEGSDPLNLTDLGNRQRLAAEQWWANALPIEAAPSRVERTDLLESRALFGRFLGANTALGEHLSSALDQSRLAAQSLESRGRAATAAAALVALVVMLVLGRRIASTISQPLTALRDTVVRQRAGELGIRAREEKGSSEIQSMARDINALSEQNLALQQSQARALNLNELTFGIARAIRAASDTQQALNIMCVALGEGLGADRVMASTFDSEVKVLFSGQWHRQDLPPLGDISADLLPDLTRLADEMWVSESGIRARDEILAPGVEPNERALRFHRETGARAVVMGSIGLGDRVIGMIHVLMVEPRRWSTPETDVVQAVAGFVARAVVEAEHQELQRDYVHKVEMLDRQKSDFLASVSHELRTPLTSISGYLELLQDEDAGKLTVQQHGMLEVIDRNTLRLRSLIEDVMMLNRIEGGVSKANFVEVSIHALINRVGEELWLLAQSNAIDLEIEAGPEGAVVLGDKASLDRAVVNVLSNAIKFSRPGGVVTIKSTMDLDAGRVLISCQDRGLGIPARDQADLFTRFFRASNATEQATPGTGLGLSIVKQIVEEHHGGQLQLISVEDEGTTVVIDLPSYEPSTTQQPPETVGNGSHSGDVYDIRV